MSKKAILKIKNISQKYHTIKEETQALENLNFEVFEKEFLCIVGPSGCGKSTILSLVSGLLKPTKGTIEIDNKMCNKTGYMLQKDYLFDWRTIKENAFLGLEIKKILNERNKNYAVNLLEKYGLGKFLNYFPHQLSGGMRQKAALIRTLAVKPEILLLDEPFSALDFQTRINLSEEVKNIIKTEGKTAILVTHDISEAISLADRILIFSNRPSKIKKILEITFEKNDLTSLEKRNSPKFSEYFDMVWKELENGLT